MNRGGAKGSEQEGEYFRKRRKFKNFFLVDSIFEKIFAQVSSKIKTEDLFYSLHLGFSGELRILSPSFGIQSRTPIQQNTSENRRLRHPKLETRELKIGVFQSYFFQTQGVIPYPPVTPTL